ncbi:MAG: hypothetical protein ACJ790_08495 [Myxococcaceae bacterium]
MDGRAEAVDQARSLTVELFRATSKLRKKEPVLADDIQREACRLMFTLRRAEAEPDPYGVSLVVMDQLEVAVASLARVETMMLIACDLGYSDGLNAEARLAEIEELYAFAQSWLEELCSSDGAASAPRVN